MSSFSAIWEYKSFNTGIWVALHLLSTRELIPSSICSFVCWIFSGDGRGRVSLLAGWSTLLASLYSLVGRWSKDFLPLWSLIVLPFPLPWSNYTPSLNKKETSFKHTFQVWPDCQPLTGFLSCHESKCGFSFFLQGSIGLFVLSADWQSNAQANKFWVLIQSYTVWSQPL